jgi:bifunctional non-homologous end joining protein LigD
MQVHRAGDRVRLFTRRGYDWTDRNPRIVKAAAALRASSFLIDGEVVVCGDDGVPSFDRLRARRRGVAAFLWAFDLMEHDGQDLRTFGRPPWSGARRRWRGCWRARLMGCPTMSMSTVFAEACGMGLVVSKRLDKPYRSGRSGDWVKTKNPTSPAVQRLREENW